MIIMASYIPAAVNLHHVQHENESASGQWHAQHVRRRGYAQHKLVTTKHHSIAFYQQIKVVMVIDGHAHW